MSVIFTTSCVDFHLLGAILGARKAGPSVVGMESIPPRRYPLVETTPLRCTQSMVGDEKIPALLATPGRWMPQHPLLPLSPARPRVSASTTAPSASLAPPKRGLRSGSLRG